MAGFRNDCVGRNDRCCRCLDDYESIYEGDGGIRNGHGEQL